MKFNLCWGGLAWALSASSVFLSFSAARVLARVARGIFSCDSPVATAGVIRCRCDDASVDGRPLTLAVVMGKGSQQLIRKTAVWRFPLEFLADVFVSVHVRICL